MSPLDPVTTLLRVARGHTWVREVGPNRGQAVEAILALVGLPPGQPWCAAFVSYIGKLVCGVAWPLPLVGGCATLGEAAARLVRLGAEPAVGAIFLLWSDRLGRFYHTGFVSGPFESVTWPTVEGNTSPDGNPEGTGVFLRRRKFTSKDRFIVWW